MIRPTLAATQDERRQLDKVARARRRSERERLCADPVHGARLHDFIATLGHFGPEHAARMVAYVKGESVTWLRSAPIEIRQAALSAVNDRVMAIRMRAGLPVVDDPLPGEDDDAFQICRRAIMS